MSTSPKVLAIVGTSGPDAEILEQLVKSKTKQALKKGCLIITGGATGVDTFVIETLLEKDPGLDNLKVLLPYAFEQSYQWKPEYGKLTPKLKQSLARAKRSVSQVIKINKPALIDNLASQIADHIQASRLRNRRLTQMADEVWAFLARPSGGTLYTVKIAKTLGKKISCYDRQGKKINQIDLEKLLLQNQSLIE